jgi:hypothetical protein
MSYAFSPHVPVVLLFFLFTFALVGAHWGRRE